MPNCNCCRAPPGQASTVIALPAARRGRRQHGARVPPLARHADVVQREGQGPRLLVAAGGHAWSRSKSDAAAEIMETLAKMNMNMKSAAVQQVNRWGNLCITYYDQQAFLCQYYLLIKA